MKTKLLNLWEKLHSSYWFIPSMLVLGSIWLSVFTLDVDQHKKLEWLKYFKWLSRTEPEGARALLSTVAGAMITVTGVVFSIGMVALQLASQQFGPRILYNFMRDRSNQFVFGTFIATYLYCLLVLRTIQGGEQNFIPDFSILVGVVLAVSSMVVLIFFIHHISLSIQAMVIVASIRRDLEVVISELFPHNFPELEAHPLAGTERAELPKEFDMQAVPVPAAREGYLQAINFEGLLHFAQKHDLVLSLAYRPGKFVFRGMPLLHAWPPGRVSAEKLEKKTNRAFLVGRKRTPEQDLEFMVNELVEIAVRALSPGINDPFTAMACIDSLGAALRDLATRPAFSPWRYDDEGKARILSPEFSWNGVVDAAFNQIRQYGGGSVAVTIRLLETIGVILTATVREEQRQPLLRHAAMIERGSRDLPEENDRKDVRERYLAIFEVLQEESGLTGEGKPL